MLLGSVHTSTVTFVVIYVVPRAPGDIDAMLRLFWRITKYALRHKTPTLVAYASMTGGIVSMLVIPRLLGTAIDTAIESGSRGQLLIQAALIIFAAEARGALTYVDEYASAVVIQRVGREIRNDIFQ